MGEYDIIIVLKKTVTKKRDIFDFEESAFLPVFDSCTTYSPLLKVFCLLLHIDVVCLLPAVPGSSSARIAGLLPTSSNCSSKSTRFRGPSKM